MGESSISISKSKKGIVGDMVFLVIGLILLATGAYVGHLITQSVNTQIQGSGFISAEGKNASGTIAAGQASWIDNAFLMVFAGLILALLVGSYFIDASPLFFIFGVLGLVILLTVAAMMSNWFQLFSAADAFIGYSGAYPKMYFIMSHLVEILLLTGLLALAVTFVKPGRSSPI